MNIALIQCPFWSVMTPPYSIALLSACLKKEGHSVLCYDFNVKLQRYSEFKKKSSSSGAENEDIDWYDRDSVLRFIKEYDYYINQLIDEVLEKDIQIAGFTIYDTSRWFSGEIASRIKEKSPAVKTVAGGISCFRENFAIEFLQNHNVDAVCLQEGEVVFNNLVNTIKDNKGRIGYCPGFIYKDSNGKIINCGKQDLVDNLDSLPFADFKDFDLRLYDETGVPISTSRGCINCCSFCEESILWGKYRRREAANIYAEIDYQLKNNHQAEYFFFNDSLVNGDMKNLCKLVDLIIEKNTKFTWSGQAMIREGMNFEFLKKMKKAGFSSVSYGLESASPKILKLMRKNFSTILAEEVIQNTKKAGISSSINIIVGFPEETWEDINLTVNFLKRNLEFIDTVYLHSLVLMPSSLLYRERKTFGIFILNRNRTNGWLIEGEKNYFQARLEKLEFIRESLGDKVKIPFNNLIRLKES
ncbi:MAG: radical SAM protein [Candidatus Omnitrophota bacterium]